jgi:hypothetical protein
LIGFGFHFFFFNFNFFISLLQTIPIFFKAEALTSQIDNRMHTIYDYCP